MHPAIAPRYPALTPTAEPRAGSFRNAATFLLVCLAVIFVLNSIPFFNGAYHPMHVVYVAILLSCVMPMFVFLLYPQENLPYFQIICLIYGLFYATFPFYQFETGNQFTYLQPYQLLDAGLLSLAGIGLMILGYYTRPIQHFLQAFRPPILAWDPAFARKLAIIFLFIGFLAQSFVATGGPRAPSISCSFSQPNFPSSAC